MSTGTEWLDPLDPEKETEMIDELADQISKRRMEVPATLFLEMHKPLSGIGSQALIAFSPFLAPFVGMDNVSNWSRLMRSRKAIDQLIERLEDKQQANVKES